MAGGPHKEVRQLLKRIKKAAPDIEVARPRRGHVKVYRRGKLLLVLPWTPSDHRWRQNAEATLRRQGIKL